MTASSGNDDDVANDSDANEGKPVVIYDTGVVLQATLSPFGVSERALAQIESGAVDAVMSNRLRNEYETVLRRLATLKKYKAVLGEEDITAQMERIDATIPRVANPPRQAEYRRDPNDEDTINLAIFYQAAFVVARDKDLFALNDDPVFRKRSPQTRVVDPVEFVQAMERRREQQGEDARKDRALQPETESPLQRE